MVNKVVTPVTQRLITAATSVFYLLVNLYSNIYIYIYIYIYILYIYTCPICMYACMYIITNEFELAYCVIFEECCINKNKNLNEALINSRRLRTV